MERTVLMEVPLSLATRVADLLDEHEAVGERPHAVATDRCFVTGQGPWTSDEVELFAARVAARGYDLIQALLAQTAASPDRWLVPDVGEVKSPYHLRNQLSAMTKLIKKDFDGRAYWPIQWRRTEDGTYNYCMPEQIAAWWPSIESGS
jgi:hypothetical protein